MQIKIEIDVQPEELRRFLGLPDVAGLQEEVVAFLRDKVSEANESFDPAQFVKANIDTVRKSKTLQRILYGSEGDGEEGAKPRKRRTTGATRKRSSRKG